MRTCLTCYIYTNTVNDLRNSLINCVHYVAYLYMAIIAFIRMAFFRLKKLSKVPMNEEVFHKKGLWV